jgi:hypothetical protein
MVCPPYFIPVEWTKKPAVYSTYLLSVLIKWQVFALVGQKQVNETIKYVHNAEIASLQEGDIVSW